MYSQERGTCKMRNEHEARRATGDMHGVNQPHRPGVEPEVRPPHRPPVEPEDMPPKHHI
jgi:hypothetical protein